jgi:hypothetical protein
MVILVAHYGDAFLSLIFANQIIPTHSHWDYKCLHTNVYIQLHQSEPEWANEILAMYQPAWILFIMKCLTQMLVAAKANELDDFRRVITHFVDE